MAGVDRYICVEKRQDDAWVPAEGHGRSREGRLWWEWERTWAIHFGWNWRQADLALFGAPLPNYRGFHVDIRLPPRGLPDDLSPEVEETRKLHRAAGNPSTWFTLHEARRELALYETGSSDLEPSELESALVLKDLSAGLSGPSKVMFRVLETLAQLCDGVDEKDIRLVVWYRMMVR